MELHHQKHHQTYITNLNAALAAQAKAIQANDVPQLIALQQKIKFNGGGHINHSLFWKNLTPPGMAEASLDDAAPTLKQAIVTRWGSTEKFVEAFKAALLGIQGSGWGWLVANAPNGKLDIVTTKDQDPVTEPLIPIFGVDMWEHAYYLQVSLPRLDRTGQLQESILINILVLQQQGWLCQRDLESHQLGRCGGEIQERSRRVCDPESSHLDMLY